MLTFNISKTRKPASCKACGGCLHSWSNRKKKLHTKHKNTVCQIYNLQVYKCNIFVTEASQVITQ